MLDKELDKEVPQTVGEYEEVRSRRSILAEKMVDTAITTKDPLTRLAYYKEISDRTEGKPTQKNELTGADGEALTFTFKKE